MESSDDAGDDTVLGDPSKRIDDEEESVAYLRRNRIPRIEVILLVLVVLLGVTTVYGFWNTYNHATKQSPLRITACLPEHFEDGDCDGDPPIQPSPPPLVLSDELGIDVAGRATLSWGSPVSYSSFEVAWESVESDRRYLVVDDSLTFDAWQNSEYEATMSPPPQMLADLLPPGTPEGTSLGRWRIVGRATPTRPRQFADYQWDGVEAFDLVAGTETYDFDIDQVECPPDGCGTP